MGYTHYWGINPTHGKAEKQEKLYQKAIKDCNKVIKAYYKIHKGTDSSLSGFSAHANGKYGGLQVNGKGDNAHEEFSLREHFKQNEGDFCKTRQKPYDLVVVACLGIMKFHLGDAFNVDSDGRYADLVDGIEFANKVLRRTKNKIINPIPFEPQNDLKLA